MGRPDVTRRNVLRQTAAATGVVAVGGTAIVGTTAADGQGAGGMGFLTDTGLSRLGEVGNEFTIEYLDEGIWLRDVQAACDRGAEADYQAYRIDDGNETAGLFVNPDRNLNTGVESVFTEVNANCGEGYLEHPTSTDGTRTITRVEFASVE